jgi:excisionase family DNA binding protein
VISEQTLDVARQAAEELRRRGEDERAEAIEALVDAARSDALPSLNLATTTEAGAVLGVSGQTIKNWVRQGQIQGYRVGSRIMVPRDALADYVRRARRSLDLEVISDEEAAALVDEGRRSH